jgi:hypothetical protein
MNSLKQTCFNQIQTQTGEKPVQVLPPHLYDEYVEYLRLQSYPEWKQKIQVVNLELNIADMDVNQDMFLDELTHHIYIKKKIKDDDVDSEEEDEMMDVDMNGEEDEEFELYHEFQDDTGLYPAYYQIAKARQYIE